MKKAIIYAVVSLLAIPAVAQPQDENWSEPINVGPPVNSATQELRPSLTPFSDMMVLRTGRGDSSGLFTTHFVDGQWTELEYVPSVGNPGSPTYPALSPDGNEIYFSCYCGGYGDYDIWRVVYDSISGTWSDPINAGPNVNDEGGQMAPFLSYDGQKLYFIDHSMRFSPGLVVSHKIGEEWSYPEWVHSNFRWAEDASLTMDERTIYFTRWIPNEYRVVFHSEKDEGGNWTEPQRFDVINDYGMGVYPRVNANGSRIYFSSGDMGGEGGYDIWYVERPTSIDENIEEYVLDRILVYPNPSNSYFNILIEGNDDSGSMVFIYDILGRELNRIEIPYTRFSFLWPENSGDIQSIASGFYFFKLIGRRGEVKGIEKAILLK
jgi:Tol biopolymer transport system component